MQIASVDTNDGTAICSRAVKHRPHERLPERQVAVNVLDRDRRVVHQNSHRERQPAKRHHVDRVTEKVQHNERGEDRKRNRDANDQRAAPAPEEHQDHQAGEQHRHQRLPNHAVDGGFHENGLIEELADGDCRRQRRDHSWQRRFHLVNDTQRGCLAVPEYREQRAACPVRPDHVGLHRIAIADLGHVPQEHRRAVHALERQQVQFVQDAGAGVQLHLVITVAELRRSGRVDEVLIADGGRNIGSRKLVRIERVRIQIHHDIPHPAPKRQRHGSALNGRKRRSDVVLAEIEQLLLGKRPALQAELQDGHARGVVLDDARRKDAGRHDSEQRLRERRDLRQAHLHLRVRLEENADDGRAIVRLRLDVLDVVDRGGEGALVNRDDALLHLLRRDPVVAPDDADHRDIDVGKDVYRHGPDGGAAKQRDRQGHDDKRIRPP